MNAPKSAAPNVSFMHLMVDYIPNNRLKGELILKEAISLYAYSDYLKVVDEYDTLLTSSQRARLKLIGAKLYSGEQGGKAENFTYPDMNGKMVSLTDFKGKVVVVNVCFYQCIGG